MSLIALTSASASPGTTTAALGLALNWPRPVVVIEADPAGTRAISAGYFRGGQLPTSANIVDLAVSHRQGTLVEDLPGLLFTIPKTTVQVLTGPLRHNQARSLEPLWEPLAGLLKSLERNGQDAIVDLGRLGLEGFGHKLLTAADLALMATRSDLPGLVAASSWAPSLISSFEHVGATNALGALLIGPGRPYGANEAAKVLNLPITATLAWDPDSARVYSHGENPHRKFASGPLNKSLRAAIQAMQSTLATSRAQLEMTVDRSPR
ncbi:hypothetical protein ACQFYA_21050 [Promicromonospora sp. Marseille-Q5078]